MKSCIAFYFISQLKSKAKGNAKTQQKVIINIVEYSAVLEWKLTPAALLLCAYTNNEHYAGLFR